MTTEKTRAQMVWDINIYSTETTQKAYAAFNTLWELLRLEKIFPEEVQAEARGTEAVRGEKVEEFKASREEVESVCRGMLDTYKASLAETRAALMKRDDGVDLQGALANLEVVRVWKVEGRTQVGIYYMRILTLYAELEGLGLAAIAAGDDAGGIDAVMSRLRMEFGKMSSGLRKQVHELSDAYGLSEVGKNPKKRARELAAAAEGNVKPTGEGPAGLC